MSWQDDLKKIDEVFHQKLRIDATFEWLYSQTIEQAHISRDSSVEVIDGLTQLGKHVVLHGRYQLAKRLFEKTLELTEFKVGFNDIRSGKLCDCISHCLMMQGRFNEALATIEKWINESQDKCDKSTAAYHELLAHYAELLYRAGKHENAREVIQNLVNIAPSSDPLLRAMLTEKLALYETPCPTTFDPADHEQAQLLREEMLHGSPASLESLRQAVLDIVVKQAIAGAPWKDVCKGAMEINGITIAEVESEITRRTSPTH